MLLVTGGLLYSNVAAALNVAGPTDIAVCDFLGKKGKWRNLAKRQIAAFVPPAELENWLKGTAPRHADSYRGDLGGRRRRTATLSVETNFNLSMPLLDWCAPRPRRCCFTLPPRQLSATARRVLTMINQSGR